MKHKPMIRQPPQHQATLSAPFPAQQFALVQALTNTLNPPMPFRNKQSQHHAGLVLPQVPLCPQPAPSSPPICPHLSPLAPAVPPLCLRSPRTSRVLAQAQHQLHSRPARRSVRGKQQLPGTSIRTAAWQRVGACTAVGGLHDVQQRTARWAGKGGDR